MVEAAPANPAEESKKSEVENSSSDKRPVEEAITSEELIELGKQLKDANEDPELAVKIMRVLDRKAVTAKLLIATKVGKCLTTVCDKPNPEKPLLATTDKVAEVSVVKENLMRKWKQVYADYKSQKAAVTEKPVLKKAESVVSVSTMDLDSKPMFNVSLPYIPGGLDSLNIDDERRQTMIEKFITKMQTPVAGPEHPYDRQTLLKGIEAGKGIEKVIFDYNPSNEKARKEKFRSMIAVLTSHAYIKTKVLAGEITPLELVNMKRDDFLSEDMKRQKKEAEEARMQAARTDFLRSQDLKKGLQDSFFKCRKCKSMKTSYYQQQTRGADEPMTNFVECLVCLYKWKE